MQRKPGRDRIRPTYGFKHFGNHPLFPGAKTVFQVAKPGDSAGPTERHAIVITSRDVPQSQFDSKKVEFVHTQNLGGKQGPMVAHVFRELSEIHTGTKVNISVVSPRDLRNAIQHGLGIVNVPFQASEINKIVKKLRLD